MQYKLKLNTYSSSPAYGWHAMAPTASPRLQVDRTARSLLVPPISHSARTSSSRSRASGPRAIAAALRALPPPIAAATAPASDSSRPLLRLPPLHPVLPPAIAIVKVRGPILADRSSPPLVVAWLRAGGLLPSPSFLSFARVSFAW
jgi:hypothetical protein